MDKIQERRSIMGACEYSLGSLKSIQKELLTLGNIKEKSLTAWAVGGLVITLTANLLKITQDRILESTKTNAPNAKDDLIFIRDEFSKFIDHMLNHE